MVESIKTFGQKVSINEEFDPNTGQRIQPEPGTEPAAPAVEPVPAANTFGSKAQYWNRQVNMPRTPFNLSSFDFRNKKFYYLNIFGALRNKDDEEALRKFHEACDTMRSSKQPPLPEQPTTPEQPQVESVFAKLVDEARSIRGTKKPVRNQFTEPQVDHGIASNIQAEFKKYGIFMSDERCLELAKNSKSTRISSDYKPEHIGNVLKEIYPEYFSSKKISRDADELVMMFDRFVKRIGGDIQGTQQNVKRQNAINFYQKIPDFTSDLRNMFFDTETGKSSVEISTVSEDQCAPFTLDENGDVKINDFTCFINVIENRITVAARDNIGVSPYKIVEKYMNAEGLIEDPNENEDTENTIDKENHKNTNYDEEMSNESFVTEAEGQSTTPRKPNASYRGGYRSQAGGEIYSTQQRIGVKFNKEGEELERASTQQVESFHKLMVEYFLKPGLLVYLFPQDYEKMVAKGGAVPAAFNRITKEFMSAVNSQATTKV